MDIKTTFLNGVVEEEVYVEPPLGFETHDRQTRVQIEEILVRIETRTQDMVQQDGQLPDELRIYQG